MTFSWLTEYWPLLLEGLWRTVKLIVLSGIFGFLLAIPVALAQVSRGAILPRVSRAFTTTIRGTPLLVQLYLLYYGVGDLLSDIPAIRYGPLWPWLRDGFWYATLAFTISVAAYTGEIIRGGLMSVPRGEIEAARAFGMSRFKILRRIWLPRALHISLPALSGEAILLLKSTPLASTVTVIDLFGAANVVRSETFLTYEPLLFVAAVYVACTLVIAVIFRLIELSVPSTKGI